MARPIWTGSLSFGLLNIPIQLMPGERRTDISFRMLDSRTRDPVRYERVNADEGPLDAGAHRQAGKQVAVAVAQAQ